LNALLYKFYTFSHDILKPMTYQAPFYHLVIEAQNSLFLAHLIPVIPHW